MECKSIGQTDTLRRLAGIRTRSLPPRKGPALLLPHKTFILIVEVLDSNGNVRESALTATITGKYALAPVCITPRTPRQECRKRKNMEIYGPRTQISQVVPGHSMPFETIAERCKVTARRGCYKGYALGAIKRFSNNTKQWECHDEEDGRQVVTILDSSDEEKEERYRQFSFGSAQTQRYKPSKIQRLIKYLKDKGAYVPHKSKPPTKHVVEVNGEKMVRNAMPGEEIVAGKRQTPKSIMIDKPGHESERKNLNFSGDSLTCQAPGSRMLISTAKNVTMAVVNDTIAQDNAKEVVGKNSFEELLSIATMPVINTVNGSQKDNVHSFEQDRISREHAEKHDIRVEVDGLHLSTRKDLEHEGRCILRLPSASEAYKKFCELPDIKMDPGFGHGATQNTQGDKRELQTEVMQITNRLAPRLQSEDMLTEMDSETVTHVTESPSQLQLESRDKTDSTKMMSSQEFKQFANTVDTVSCRIIFSAFHEKDSISLNQASPLRFCATGLTTLETTPVIKTNSTTLCVLKSRRGLVAKIDRERTLRAAEAWTMQLRNPHFVVVMKGYHVYTDFNMDIPAEFAKKSKLPATEAKMTLMCDEVPTTCKAIWEGTNPMNPKLSATGWMDFSRSHFLEEGDVCVFELFNNVTVRIGVHIFRVVGLRRSQLGVDWTQHYKVVEANHRHHPSN